MRDDCPCKEEVEKEEATALAQAIERSFAQQVALPHVPGLTSEESEVLTIRCEEEVSARTRFTNDLELCIEPMPLGGLYCMFQYISLS